MIHWLGICLQAWGAFILLYTFSDGIFLARLAFVNKLCTPNSYAYYPQFWYSVLGCALLPSVGSGLKRTMRWAWFLAVGVVTVIAVGAGSILLLDVNGSILHIAKWNLVANICAGVPVFAVLNAYRNYFFRDWGDDPDWISRPKLKLRDVFRDILRALKVDCKSFLKAPWGLIVYKAFSFIVVLVVLGSIAVLSGEMLCSKAGGLEKFCKKRIANWFGPEWQIKWNLRWRPDRTYHYMYGYTDYCTIDLLGYTDEIYTELCKLGGEKYLQAFRRDALSYGLNCNRRDVVEFYLDLKVPKDNFSRYCYMDSAVRSGNISMVKRMMTEGVPLTIKEPRTQRTVLYASCDKENVEMAEWLIENGVDPMDKNTVGQTVLFRAVSWKSVPMTKFFIEKGCDPKALDFGGGSLLHSFGEYFSTSSTNNLAMLKFLIDRNMDPELKNLDGKRPVDLVYESSRNDWKELWDKALDRVPEKELCWFEWAQNQGEQESDMANCAE